MAITLISEQVLAATAASVTFSSIPQTYKDLYVEGIAINNLGTYSSLQGRINGDTGADYSSTQLLGNGSTAASARSTNATAMILSDDGTPTVPAAFQIHVMDYTSTTIYKTLLSRGASSGSVVGAYVNLWRSTAAITSLSLFEGNTSYLLNAGTTIRLWGIA